MASQSNTEVITLVRKAKITEANSLCCVKVCQQCKSLRQYKQERVCKCIKMKTKMLRFLSHVKRKRILRPKQWMGHTEAQSISQGRQQFLQLQEHTCKCIKMKGKMLRFLSHVKRKSILRPKQWMEVQKRKV